MRVTLVHVPRPEYAGGDLQRTFIMIMPVGLLGLADALDRDGHEVEVLHLGLATLRDPRFDLVRYLRRRSPDLVGFSLHWHHQLSRVLAEARQVGAALSQAQIILGGLTATFYAQELLVRFPFIHAVVRGDGELPLRCLAAGDEPSSIPNLTFRDKVAVVQSPFTYTASSAQLDALDFARVDLLRDADLYSARWFLLPGDPPGSYGAKKVFYLCGGRGCTVNCTFCGGSREAHCQLSRRTDIALRSPERLLDDAIKAGAHGYQTLYLCFDPPGIPVDHYPRFFRLAARAGLRQSMIFECYGLPSERFLDAFADAFDAPESQIAFSPDCADEATRQRHKGYFYTNEDLRACLAACASRDLRTTLYFTLFPGVGWDEVHRLRAWQDSLRGEYGCALITLPIEVEPASAWHKDPRAHGLPHGPLDLDHFIHRHQTISSPPGPSLRTPAPLPGHPGPDLEQMLALLRPKPV